MPVGEVALALGCLLDKVFGGFGRFWRAPGGFGGFWRVWRVWRVSRVLEGGPTGQVPHLRWSQAPPRPWRRPGSADIYIYRQPICPICIYVCIYAFVYLYVRYCNVT